MVDLSNFVSMSFGAVPEQKLLAEGIYEMVISGYYDTQYEKDGETRTIINIRLKAAEVVEADFEEEDLDVSEPVRMTFFCTGPALAQKSPVISVRAFVRDILDLSTDEVDQLDVGPALEMLTGRRFRAVLRHEMGGKNKDVKEAKVAKILEVV